MKRIDESERATQGFEEHPPFEMIARARPWGRVGCAVRTRFAGMASFVKHA
jgi:hypothetical protein